MNTLLTEIFREEVNASDGARKQKYLQRNLNACGYFCAKILINVLGSKDTRNLGESLHLDKDGVSQTKLVSTLRSRGVSATVKFNLTEEKITNILKKGKYIIVYDHNEEHWLIITDLIQGVVHFYDPRNYTKTELFNVVEKTLDGYGIVCGKK